MNALAYHRNKSRDTVPDPVSEGAGRLDPTVFVTHRFALKAALKRAAVESQPVRKELVGATMG